MIDVVQPFWKPVGWTSFDVVQKLRGITKIRKIGHTGTLDPFAEGILVLCFGQATKRVNEFMDLDKEYQAVVRLGRQTDTLDPDGKIIAEQAVTDITAEQVQEILPQFTGDVMQIPPMYSALKFKGRRLYQLARKGEMVERAPRPIRIDELRLDAFMPPDRIKITVICGRGTYIRVLAADIAVALGTVGMLDALIRTRIGPYDQSSARTMEEAVSWIPITG